MIFLGMVRILMLNSIIYVLKIRRKNILIIERTQFIIFIHI